ncbi:MAG TPA: hypothetical protein VFM06_06150 [Candidatus Limnocylindria bacterium]|nr:hypothetical protein [Candidatus Limnocylindria bacterium]
MTLFGIALRSHRTGASAIALMAILTGALNAVAYGELAGTTEAARQAFAQQMTVLGKQLSYLLPEPVQLETMAGYLTWRAFGAAGLVFAIWATLAATGLGRGDEERGLTEHWLASGVSRARWLLTRAAGYALASLAVTALTVIATAAAAAAVGDPLPAGPLALEALLLWGLCLASFGIGLAVAQLVVTRRAAGSLAAIAIVGLFVLNSAGRSGLDTGAVRALSPFALFERSAPLLRDAPFDAPATAMLFATGLLLTLASVLAFTRRDVGGALLGRAARRTVATSAPSRDPLLRLPVLALIDQQRWAIAGWSVGISTLAYFMTSIARAIVESVSTIPTMRVYFERLGIAAYSDFVGVIWFGTALFLLSGLVVTQVSAWAADDAEGRLETVLAAGASRTRVVLERIAALLAGAGAVAATSSLVVYLAAGALDIAVDRGRMVLATGLLLPVVYALAGIGHALVAWRPRTAVIVVGAIAVVSYFIQQFAPIFDTPAWVGRLSIYTLYGTPMSKDEWGGAATLVAMGTTATILAVLAMRRRDVGA